MEAAKQNDYLTWAYLTIVDDELKTVREYDIKLLKSRDLWKVCSQLKVRGVKNSTKKQMISKLVPYTKSRQDMTSFQKHPSLYQQERSRSALIGF